MSALFSFILYISCGKYTKWVVIDNGFAPLLHSEAYERLIGFCSTFPKSGLEDLLQFFNLFCRQLLRKVYAEANYKRANMTFSR